MEKKPFTQIGTPTSDTDQFRMRGRDVLGEILGEKSFSETFYLLVTGRELPQNYTRTFDACMVILMDHGITPTALVARMVHDSLPEDVQLPMIAGTMMVGNKFAGTMAGAGAIFREGVDAGGDPREFAVSVIKFLFLFLGLYYIYFEIQKINFDLIFNLNIYHLLIAFLFFLCGTSLFAYVWFRLLAESENISMLETIKIYFAR